MMFHKFAATLALALIGASFVAVEGQTNNNIRSSANNVVRKKVSSF
jgi:hypothetical protein